MSDRPRFRIGYALLPKKQRSFLQPSLLEHATSKGIDLVPIDFHTPLSEQGPFDAILHKVSEDDWYQQLTAYGRKHPDVIIVDAPEAIERLHNRISMLQAVAELQVSEELNTFGIPKQCVLDGSSDVSGLKFPVIAKPLVADGSAKSHAMSLVFNAESLAKLKPPLVLQEFVNHGGVIFKVYVVADYVQCVRRRSLPDIHEDQLKDCKEPLPFSQISNMASSEQSNAVADLDLPEIELPPPKFISNIATGLRKALGLRLFNFDIIRDVKAGNHYHIIDINYFPGYAKMPAYETVLTDFFLSLAEEKASSAGCQPIDAVSC